MLIPGRKYFKGESVNSDWFPRDLADNLILTFERITSSGATDMNWQISVLTKNDDSSGSSAKGKQLYDGSGDAVSIGLGTDGEVNNIQIFSGPPSGSQDRGLEEWVRLQFQVLGSGGDATDWILGRVLWPPILFPDGNRFP